MKKALAYIFSDNSWFIKYKLYHIPFWFAYHVMWWTITIGSLSAVANNILYSAYSIKFLFYVIFQAIGVYFNLYFLIPRFLHKGKYALYILFLLITIIVVAFCIVSGYYTSAYLSEYPFQYLYSQPPSNFMYFFSINALPSTMASTTLGMSVKLTKNWIQAERKQRLLEKEKLETELKFLKSQFNPHFLFNTINSIFVLIHKNQDMASDSLAKFSDLLRYQLYECNENHIPFDRELSYLKSFIELSKLRLDPKDVSVSESLPAHGFGSLQIAPFILMPFIENAFKHVEKSTLDGGKIMMSLQTDAQHLFFTIRNTVALQPVQPEVLKTSGIGLQNVFRRLSLLYPERHHLNISKTSDWFEVQLQINLETNLY
ncbi:sensor histidine kinase [Emticicia sp. 17c]|uniref:sensor histidine kinase n=1 Tax=Emticicia sp. 17c TaxID=3127704 RepID=UPI00301C0675